MITGTRLRDQIADTDRLIDAVGQGQGLAGSCTTYMFGLVMPWVLVATISMNNGLTKFSPTTNPWLAALGMGVVHLES